MRVLTFVVATLLGQPCFAAMPCVAVAQQVNEILAYHESNPAVLDAFRACLSSSKVCSLTQTFDGTAGAVLATSTAPQTDGASRSSIATTVQDERAGTCLLAAYGGGSSAAWLLQGWAVSDKTVQVIPRMSEYPHHGELESTRALVSLVAKAQTWAKKSKSR